MRIKESVNRWAPTAAGAMTVALLLFLVASQALASHVQPEVIRGAPSCSDYSQGGTEFRISATERFYAEDSGMYTDGTFQVTITFYDTPEGQEFNWTANRDVDVIVAKGGSLASIYRYSTPVKMDAELHAPFNDTRSLWYPSRYISFCYLPEKPTIVETTTTAAVAATSQAKAVTTTTMAPTTTKAAEVLPSVVTTAPSTSTTKPGAAVTTAPPEVLDTEVLPFTGMSDDTLWLLGLGLIAAGTTAVVSTRSSRRDD